VKVTIYVTNAAYYATINGVYARYFPANPPARTFVTVGSCAGVRHRDRVRRLA